MLSPNLNEKVSIEIFTSTVKKNLPLRTAITNLVRQKFSNPRAAQARQYEDKLILPIVKRMETKLTLPDTIVIQQYTQGEALYIVSKGECTVHVNQDAFQYSKKKKKAKKDSGSVDTNKVKRLRPGYLFGEISLVYNCLTTSTIQSSKYCNLGKLTKEKFNDVVTIYPSIRTEI